MWKTYFLRTEEPLGCPLGPSWNSAAAPGWAPALDGPVLAEHCLRPVWLSAFARMCGGTSEADDALWAEVDELGAQQGGEAVEATARLIERLSLFGAPWLAHGELPAPSRGGLWLNVPSTSATGEDEDAGFAAETAALRAAYALARIATGDTVAAAN